MYNNFSPQPKNVLLQPLRQQPFTPDMILYQSLHPDTHYTISARDFENRVYYILEAGRSYKVQVCVHTLYIYANI